MPILHCNLQYCMKFPLSSNSKARNLDEKYCPTMILWDKIDYWKPLRMPYSLRNVVRKSNLLSENDLFRFPPRPSPGKEMKVAWGTCRAKGAPTISDARGSNGASPRRYNLAIQSMIEFRSKTIQFNFRFKRKLSGFNSIEYSIQNYSWPIQFNKIFNLSLEFQKVLHD